MGEIRIKSRNLVESYVADNNKNRYITVLYAEADLKPNTTYTIALIINEGYDVYFNEKIFSNWSGFTGDGTRKVFVLTTRSDLVKNNNTYTSGKGWWILKNNKYQAIFISVSDFQILEGTYTSETIPEYQPYFLNKPAHQVTNGQFVDIPTHHYTNGRWQGELTSQSPLKFRADGEMLDWRVEGRKSENLYSIEMKDDAWTSFRGGKIISRSDNVLQILTTDSEQSSGVYTAASSILRQLSTLSDTVSMSVDICCDNPDAKISIGFETDGKLLNNTTITSDFQHYEVTNFTFSKVQVFIVYCANKQAANIYIKNLMINLGSTALPYEPYGGVGDWDETEQKYRIPLTIEGENLFNPETSTSVYLDARGVEHQSEQSFTTDYISVNANTMYTLGLTGNTSSTNATAYCFYNSNKEFISSNTYVPSARGNIVNLLTPNNCAYVRFSYNRLRELVEFVEGQYNTLPPYSTITNISTDHQLMDGDSIDFTTDQTAIPLATGNNTLSVDTAVKPKSVFVKFEG